jgi:hypothetical protein
MFCEIASAVPRYQNASSTRCCAGSRSMNSLASPRRKFQPRCRCLSSEWDLYWVSTPMRRMPELMQFESAKSMMRNLPPKYTAGLARRSVRSSRREPRPPASTRAIVRLGSSRARIMRSIAVSVASPPTASRMPRFSFMVLLPL